MQSTILNKCNLKVSKLCIGTRQFTNWNDVNISEIEKIIAAAIENEINFFDTAEKYGSGESEKILSQVIKNKRKDLILASKINPAHCKNPIAIRQSLEASLKRLKTDYLDIYYQHWPPKNPILISILEEFIKFKEEGKIRAIGVSNWTEPEFEEVGELANSIDVLQPCYNLAWRQIENNIFEICKKFNISIVTYSPLAQGILSKNVAELEAIKLNLSDPRNENILINNNKIYSLLNMIETLSLKYNCRKAEIAISWINHNKNISSIICGQTNMSQLKANINSFNLVLSDQDYLSLNQFSQTFSEKLDSHSTMWGKHPRS